jgi:hypothetical protein
VFPVKYEHYPSSVVNNRQDVGSVQNYNSVRLSVWRLVCAFPILRLFSAFPGGMTE